MSGTAPTARLTFRLRGNQPEPLSREARRRLHSRDGKQEAKWDKNWDTFLMRSSKSLRLGNYLQRYCDGMTDGVSILLAGERGAGKTTLVKLLIQNAITHSTGLIPLPVFLHGPTVIDRLTSEPLQKAGSEETPKEANVPSAEQGDPLVAGFATLYLPLSAVRDGVGAPSSRDPYEQAREAKANALPKMIIALYGSLGDALCEAWRNAAEQSPHGRRATAELLELAAHLDRMLELAPIVEPLRKLWLRGGFLRNGVAHYLRPSRPLDRAKGPSPQPRAPDHMPRIAGRQKDQGVREIVALVACSDAFRGVIGKNTEKVSNSLGSEEKRQAGLPQGGNGEKKAGETKSEQDKKETGARIGPPAIGAVAAAATLPGVGEHNVLLSLLIGTIVWSVSWFVWNYNIARKTSKSLTRESTFEIDWTEVKVLERRFPSLLQRVKDAGFAPIFILDELDKLEMKENASDTTDDKLDDFLKLTKHIVADHAAFFFLVNRDYYEKLERLSRGMVVRP